MTSLSESPVVKAESHLSHPKYRPDIDGMRAIAVLSVVFFHAFPDLISGGFVGVDVFFVISGFLISSIITGSLKNNNFSFKTFYSRRVHRIFPALFVVLFASWAFGWVSLFPEEFLQLGKHITAGTAFISNFALLNESGYFDNSSDTKILLHLWSLGIEEQFYLIWPLILWFAWKLRFNILALTIGLTALSFTMNIVLIKNDAISVFYSPHTRFWELLAGALLAHISINRPEFLDRFRSGDSPAIRNLLSITGITLLAYAFFNVTKENSFPGWWAALPVIGSVMLIAAGPFALLNRYFLANRVMVKVGLISFPLYLWHWPILAYLRVIESGTPPVEARWYAIAASVVLAWLTYRLIETPLKTVSSRIKTVVLSLMMIAIGLTGYYTYASAGLPERSMVRHLNNIFTQFVGPLWAYTKNDICMARYPFSDSEDYGWWFCMQSRDASPTVMLIGTSHANQLFPGIAKNQETQQQTVLSIGACDPARLDITPEGEVAKTHPCYGDRPLKQKQLIDEIIEKSGSVKIAIIDGLTQEPDLEYGKRLQSYIDSIERKGVKVVVFLPHIPLGYSPKACFSRPFINPIRDCSLPYEKFTKINESYAPIIKETSESNPKTKFFDQKKIMCNNGSCNAILDGMPLFRDETHISEFASIKLGEIFVKWAKNNAPELLEK
ncbi:acyltransferase family protein [Pseudomonas protegens]|uniref:acyltransferase family protein n=1 Tax=Pseudomonas protegens TaxID=380021 RepID=UPI00293713FD|nr:acyltransferase family protein [Pseudomonas protegens]WOE81727.1 acyltransferase family protein [Pseudomonas protegens]